MSAASSTSARSTPLTVKGRTKPVRAYEVLRSKPRTFRMPTRGDRGCRDAHGRSRPGARCAPRLLRRRDARPDACVPWRSSGSLASASRACCTSSRTGSSSFRRRPTYLKARALATRQNVPYGVFRDLIASRFSMLDSDRPDTVAVEAPRRIRAAPRGRRGRPRRSLAGLRSVTNRGGSPDPRIAWIRVGVHRPPRRVPEVTGERRPRAHRDRGSPLGGRGLVEPPRRPGGTPRRLRDVDLDRDPTDAARGTSRTCCRVIATCQLLRLTPLDDDTSRALVADVLQHVSDRPDSLVDLITRRAEGNPFFVEELIKMLIDDGVIVPGGSEMAWRIDLDQLEASSVPSTLTGVLEARLDSLAQAPREALQRAAVVGRVFWDAAVGSMDPSVVGDRDDRGIARTSVSASWSTERDQSVARVGRGVHLQARPPARRDLRDGAPPRSTASPRARRRMALASRR